MSCRVLPVLVALFAQGAATASERRRDLPGRPINGPRPLPCRRCLGQLVRRRSEPGGVDYQLLPPRCSSVEPFRERASVRRRRYGVVCIHGVRGHAICRGGARLLGSWPLQERAVRHSGAAESGHQRVVLWCHIDVPAHPATCIDRKCGRFKGAVRRARRGNGGGDRATLRRRDSHASAPSVPAGNWDRRVRPGSIRHTER